MKVRLMLVREGRWREVAITRPRDAYEFMRGKCSHLDREHLWRIDLDVRNRVLGYEVVSIGTTSASLVHPREVFKGAILNNASGIILAHNHPSQDLSLSPEDRETTKRIQKAGELMGIPLLDHMVLTDGGYLSFRERGLL